MTHDELITYIDDSTDGLKHEDLFEKLLANTKALRAVVELHKPSQDDYMGEIGCVGCDINSEYGTWQEAYPCRTIRAIEKELE